MKHPSHWQDGIDRLQQRLAAWQQQRNLAPQEVSLENAARLLAELAESQVELAREYEALHQAHGEMLQNNEHLRRELDLAPHVEEALRTQAQVLENMAEGVAVTDPQGCIIYTNPAFDVMFGYDRGELLGRPSHLLNAYPPEEGRGIIQDILHQIRTTGVWIGGFHNRKKDGSSFYSAARVSALTLNGKRLYISLQEDITAQKRAQQEIERLASFPEMNPNPVLEVDEGGRVLYANPVAREAAASLGVAEGVRAFLPPDLGELFTRVREGGPRQHSFDLALGDKFYAVYLSFPQDLPTARVYAMDITERRQAEVALQESEERYRSLFQNNHSIMLLIDSGTGDLVDANPAACDYYGYVRDDLLTKKITDLNILNPAQVFLEMERAKTEERNYFEFQHRLATGEIRDVEVFSGPIRVQGRKLLYSIVHDNTARKQAEAALRRAYDELEDRVAERTAALRLANEQLLREMTERQEAEDRLRESEARFTAFMQHLPGLAVMRDVQGRYVFANQAAEKLIGTDWQGKPLEEFWPPNEARRFHRMDQQVLLAGKPVESLETLTLPDGPRHILSYRFPIRDKDGLPYMVGTIGIDVTARHQAETALAAERQRLFSLLENLPAFIYLQDKDYAVRFANRQFRKRFGEPDGRLCYSILRGLEEPCPDCPTLQIFDTGEPLDWEWRAPDGHIYQIYDYPFEDVDGSPLVLEMGIDITERKTAEEALAQNEAMLRLILDNLPVGVHVADHNGKIILGNPAGRNIWGGARYVGIEQYGEYRGWWADTGRRIAPEEWALARAVQKGEKSIGEIINIQGFDGARKVIRNSAVPLRGPHQEILGGMVVIEDITEVRRAEKVMREQARQLQAFFAHSLTPFVLLDRNFNFLQVNDAYARSCQRQAWEFIGRNHFEFYPHEENQAIFAEVLRTKTPYQAVAKAFEFPDHPEWGVTYWDWSLTPILDEAGEIDFLVFSLKDVTARVNAEEERRRLVDILENTPDFVGIADFYGRMQYLNRAGRAMVGVGEDEDVHRLKVLQLHPEGIGELIIKEGAPAAMRQGVWQAEAALLHQDGREIPVSQVILAHKDPAGRVQFFSTIARDISDLKEAQESILRQTALLNGINRIFWDTLTCETEEELGHTCLAVAEELTSSRFGFIDTINDQGTLDALAFSDTGWEFCRLPGVSTPKHLKNIRPVGLLGKPVREGQALVINNPAAHPEAAGLPAGHPPLTAYLGAPLIFGRQTIGLIGLGNKAGGYTDDDQEAIEILAPTMVEALMHHRARKDIKTSERKLRYLADQLLTAQENERKRLAAELHDELGHALLTLKLAFSSILRELLPGQDNLKQQIENQLAYINEVIGEVRRLYHDLSPGDVEDLGLTRALQGLIEDFGVYQRSIAWFVDLPDLDQFFSLPVQTIIYRIVQEALTNIGKHANPEHVNITAARKGSLVRFVIQDDGKGFELSEVLDSAKGLGLASMEERLNMVGGYLSIETGKNQGTRLSFSIPVRPEDNLL
jgi:PAS domain S-box-containing protein